MSTLTVTNVNTGSNSTPLNIATGGTYGGSIKLEASNNEIKFTGNVLASNVSINGTALSPVMSAYKNKFINGNFDIWQRGTSNGMSGYYTADRWNAANVGSTKIASRQTFTTGQTDVPGEPTYYMRQVVTTSAGAGNFTLKYQAIENVRTLAGKTATMSFWAKADSSKNMVTEFEQVFGTGGSPSTQVQSIGVTTHALTSSWKKFTTTVTLPSISGKTIGTAEDSRLVVLFWFDAGSTFNSRTNSLGQQSGTFDIAQVQFEEGPVATAFEQRHLGQELALCQRYYEKSYDLTVNPGTATVYGSYLHQVFVTTNYPTWHVPFKITKRSAATIAMYSDTTGTVAKAYDSAATVDRSVLSAQVGHSGFVGYVDNISTPAITNIRFHWTADAEL